MPETLLTLGLGAVLLMVLVLPFSVRRVEEELEIFLLAMGLLAATLSGRWSAHLLLHALREGLPIAAAALVFGTLFKLGRSRVRGLLRLAVEAAGLRLVLFLLVAGLGFLSSVVTAIIAALILVEVISALELDKEKELRIVVLACFGVGLGAVLTPVGEPLSTIATSKLSGEPHRAGFFFLAGLLGPWVAFGVLASGLLAAAQGGPSPGPRASLTQDRPETWATIAFRALRVYGFVAALVLLGEGFAPLVDRHLLSLPKELLYWVNALSAVLDNATLAAAEISPRMSLAHIRFLLLGLLTAGVMLIPGNIPNIICAQKLGIKSRDWARVALPFGAVWMGFYFAALKLAERLGR